MDNPLHILGIKPGDTLETAKKHRNALFLKLHPDKNKEDSTHYQKVYDAYEAVKNNPKLLNNVCEYYPTISLKSLCTSLNVNLEDFYFSRKKRIKIFRNVFCKFCHGTGVKSASGICEQCDGKGKINSNIFVLLNKGSTCPVCNGTGIKPGYVCNACGGSKYQSEEKHIEFFLRLKDYHKKVFIIYNAGHQLSEHEYGSIYVKLNIDPCLKISIEDNYFVIYDKVLPVQKIIGDTKTINIFGRNITYEIKKGSTDSYTIDKINKDLSQEIRIKYIEIKPTLTKETLNLYKKILSIEKIAADD